MPKPPPSKPIKIWRREEGPPPSYGWVCFHCGTCCETYKDAKEHLVNMKTKSHQLVNNFNRD